MYIIWKIKTERSEKKRLQTCIAPTKGLQIRLRPIFDANVRQVAFFLQKNANTVLLWKQHWMAEIFQSVFILI